VVLQVRLFGGRQLQALGTEAPPTQQAIARVATQRAFAASERLRGLTKRATHMSSLLARVSGLWVFFPGWARRVSNDKGPFAGKGRPYLIESYTLNIGRYIAITMNPTMPPTTMIMIGSRIEVRAFTAAATCSS
jgi:hypothetical protein